MVRGGRQKERDGGEEKRQIRAGEERRKNGEIYTIIRKKHKKIRKTKNRRWRKRGDHNQMGNI